MSTKPFNVAADNPTAVITQITSEVKVAFDKNLFFISGSAGGNACGKIIFLVGISFFFNNRYISSEQKLTISTTTRFFSFIVK